MKKIELDIVALSQTVAQSNNYAIVLGEKEGSRRLPIIIGNCEAQSIALALEGMQPTRPLTHDLIKNILRCNFTFIYFLLEYRAGRPQLYYSL